MGLAENREAADDGCSGEGIHFEHVGREWQMRKLSKLFFVLAVALSLAAWTFLSSVVFVEPVAARLPDNCDKTQSTVVCTTTIGTLKSPGKNKAGVLKGTLAVVTTSKKGSLKSSHTPIIKSTTKKCVDRKC
jgi:hypothetical protein